MSGTNKDDESCRAARKEDGLSATALEKLDSLKTLVLGPKEFKKEVTVKFDEFVENFTGACVLPCLVQ
jgi:hypothetical protein